MSDLLVSHHQMETIEERLKPLRLSVADYDRIVSMMEENMDHGLSEKADISADVKMYITYVRTLPDGSEVGKFLALDLGGTNFRVLLIELESGKVELKSHVFAVPEDIMLGPGKGLFNHIAKGIREFLEEHGLENEPLPMGFTFSFPCSQEGLSRSRLVTWTKGFKCSGVEGEDIVTLLHEAIASQKLRVKCVAVINDTVGALLAGAHTDQDCQIGLILGTGTNACYMEETTKIAKWQGDKDSMRQVVINTEWGAFGNNGCLDFIVSEYDKGVDQISKNPKEQIYEKMISGMYLGEVARQVIIKLIQEGLLFNGELSEKLGTPMMFFTKYLSEIEAEEGADLTNVKQILDELDIFDYTLTDCLILRRVCEVVSMRAAYLSAAGVAALLKRVSRTSVTVAVDGSLYRYHPKFHNLMTEMTQQLLPEQEFKLRLSHDGSGVGAALVAAVSTRQMAAARA